MTPTTNRDLLRHASGRFQMPTSHERAALRRQMRARRAILKHAYSAVWGAMSRALGGRVARAHTVDAN